MAPAVVQDCAVWIIVKLRSAGLGFRVLIRTWKFESHGSSATAYYVLNVIKEFLLPLLLTLLLALSRLFGTPLPESSEPRSRAVFYAAFQLLSRIPRSHVYSLS
jgi:hypothetical protein